jgi:hypothetical protein
MHANIRSEYSLRDASDLFVTFLYAAAVHLVIAHFALPAQQLGPPPVHLIVRTSGVVLLFVIFLFSDWIGRVRLPWLLPPEDQVGVSKQLLKTALEVASLFFLVLAWLAIIEIITTGKNVVHEGEQAVWSIETWLGIWWGVLSPYKAFTIFLLATFAWNLLMLKVMRGITWFDLVVMTFRGDALDSAQGRYYAKRFWQFRDELERRVQAQMSTKLQSAAHNLKLASATFYVEACVRMFAQIVAFHIALTNILAAIFIFTGDTFSGGTSVYAKIVSRLGEVNWPTTVVETWERMSSIYAHRTTTLIILVIYIVLLVLLFALRLIPFICSKNQEMKLRLIHITTLLLLVSAIWSRATLIVLLIVGIPILIFHTAAKSDGAKKARRKLLGGIMSVLLLVLLYLIVEPKLLLGIVAFQQVAINAFLQYAASDPGAPLLQNEVTPATQADENQGPVVAGQTPGPHHTAAAETQDGT